MVLAEATKGISAIFKIGFASIFIVITILSVIYTVIETHSIEPVFKDLASKWFLTTQQLSLTSKQIVLQGGVIASSNQLFAKIWAVIKNFSLFFYYIYIIYLWLKILSFIVSRMPGQSTDKKFRNVSIAIFIFLFLQSLLVFGNAAVAKQVDCFSGCSGRGVIDYMLIPITSLIDVWHVLPYIFTPILHLKEDIYVNITTFP